MRHEKTVSVSKIRPLWEPLSLYEDETPRKKLLPLTRLSNCYVLVLQIFGPCSIPVYE